MLYHLYWWRRAGQLDFKKSIKTVAVTYRSCDYSVFRPFFLSWHREDPHPDPSLLMIFRPKNTVLGERCFYCQKNFCHRFSSVCDSVLLVVTNSNFEQVCSLNFDLVIKRKQTNPICSTLLNKPHTNSLLPKPRAFIRPYFFNVRKSFHTKLELE